MLQQMLIQQIIAAQEEKIQGQSIGLRRDLLSNIPDIQTNSLMISGIRNCGKSALLLQLLKRYPQSSLYLNFEDPRLFDFEFTDFQSLDNIIKHSRKTALFFDEIQVVEGWEAYIRQKIDEGFKVIIAGSSASLLGELGTKLTRGYASKELFPFSYDEFLDFKSLAAGEQSLKNYLDLGGFPQYLKTNDTDILFSLFSDIIERGIIVRRGIRDIRSLKRLAIYLVSNVGNLISATKMQQLLGIKTPTILDYFSFLEDSYLAGFMHRFSRSQKVQSVNPKKIYIIDSAMVKAVSISFSQNYERLLENSLYWNFRRQGKDVYYFNENNSECDFVIINNDKPEILIQVCYELNPENTKREQSGLNAAMDFFNTDKGAIITYNQKASYIYKNKKVEIIPAWEYMNKISSNIIPTRNPQVKPKNYIP